MSKWVDLNQVDLKIEAKVISSSVYWLHRFPQETWIVIPLLIILRVGKSAWKECCLDNITKLFKTDKTKIKILAPYRSLYQACGISISPAT